MLKQHSAMVLTAKFHCVAGNGGKCNHVACVLFGLLDFQKTVKDAPESCTSKEQKWHQPSRKAKKMTRPLKIGTCTSMFFLFTSFHCTRSLNILHAELQSKTGNGLEVMTENLLNGT